MVKFIVPDLATNADIKTLAAGVKSLEADVKALEASLTVRMVTIILAAVGFADSILFVALRH